jgi:hypothetical protein
MNYGSSSVYDSLVSSYPGTAFAPYMLGVSCADPTVPLAQVQSWAQQPPAKGESCMMLWDLSEDNHGFTGQTDGIYLQTINDNLPQW